MSDPLEQPVRVLVVDDQQLMREGLVALLATVAGIEVVGAAGDGAAALERLAELGGAGCDVVLMDLRMPVLDGVAATGRVRREFPGVAVLVLTTYGDEPSVVAALRAGASGYLTKEAGRREIATAVRAAAAGQATFGPEATQVLTAALEQLGAPGPAGGGNAARPDGLTAREVEVITRIADGLSNAEVAAALFITEATVKTHVNNAFAKIGARTRVDATRYAYRQGWRSR